MGKKELISELSLLMKDIKPHGLVTKISAKIMMLVLEDRTEFVKCLRDEVWSFAKEEGGDKLHWNELIDNALLKHQENSEHSQEEVVK